MATIPQLMALIANLPVVRQQRLDLSYLAVVFTVLDAEADGLTAGNMFYFASKQQPCIQVKVGQPHSEEYNMLPCY